MKLGALYPKDKRTKRSTLINALFVTLFIVASVSVALVIKYVAKPYPSIMSPDGNPKNGFVCETDKCMLIQACQQNDLVEIRYRTKIKSYSRGSGVYNGNGIEKINRYANDERCR